MHVRPVFVRHVRYYERVPRANLLFTTDSYKPTKVDTSDEGDMLHWHKTHTKQMLLQPPEVRHLQIVTVREASVSDWQAEAHDFPRDEPDYPKAKAAAVDVFGILSKLASVSSIICYDHLHPEHKGLMIVY